MTMFQKGGNYVYECNGEGCGKLLHTHNGNFDAAKNVMNRNKWKAIHTSRQWDHLCPDCWNKLLPSRR